MRHLRAPYLGAPGARFAIGFGAVLSRIGQRRWPRVCVSYPTIATPRFLAARENRDT